MSSREMIEFDRCDTREEKIDDYLRKFEIFLGVVVRLVALSNVYFSLFAGIFYYPMSYPISFSFVSNTHFN